MATAELIARLKDWGKGLSQADRAELDKILAETASDLGDDELEVVSGGKKSPEDRMNPPSPNTVTVCQK